MAKKSNGSREINWKFDSKSNLICCANSGEPILEFNCYPVTKEDKDNMERIVASVNATRNIPLKTLKSDSFNDALEKHAIYHGEALATNDPAPRASRHIEG